jgi:hypothetical protein
LTYRDASLIFPARYCGLPSQYREQATITTAGYYYNTAVRDCMPLRGGYVDLEQCIPCTVDDIDETHAAYLAKMRRERESGERAGDQLEPWEVKEMKDEAVRDVLQAKVQEGRMTYRKYKQGLENLTLSGYLFDNEYESDCDECPCGENE